MKILVTGQRGLLGSACVRVLRTEHEVIATNLDLRDYKNVRDWMEINNPDAVVNCAAKVGGVKANQDYPVEFILDNLAIQNAVIRSAAETGVKHFVNVATSCLYPSAAPIPVRESALLTGPFDKSVAAYATAKLAGHALIQAYRRQYGKHQFFSVAPCNLYGYGDNYGPSAHVIPALMARLTETSVKGGKMKVWGNGKAIREFMFADDAASAIKRCLEAYAVPPELINIGSGQSTSIENLVSMICDAADYHPEIEWDESEPTGIPVKTFDTSLLNDIGFKPSVDLFDGLKATWADFNRSSSPRLK